MALVSGAALTPAPHLHSASQAMCSGLCSMKFGCLSTGWPRLEEEEPSNSISAQLCELTLPLSHAGNSAQSDPAQIRDFVPPFLQEMLVSFLSPGKAERFWLHQYFASRAGNLSRFYKTSQAQLLAMNLCWLLYILKHFEGCWCQPATEHGAVWGLKGVLPKENGGHLKNTDSSISSRHPSCPNLLKIQAERFTQNSPSFFNLR